MYYVQNKKCVTTDIIYLNIRVSLLLCANSFDSLVKQTNS